MGNAQEEAVIPGRSTGLYDIDGAEIFDGDIVMNYNAYGAIGEVRQIRSEPHVYWAAGGASMGNRANNWSSNKSFGVRLVAREIRK